MKIYIFIISICVVFILNSCDKTETIEEIKPFEFTNTTKILGHRGSGNTGFGIYFENTLPSVINAMNILNGVEVDIQMSKDKTVWLFHDSKLYDCGNISLPCVPSSTDLEISSINNCFGDSIYFTKLEEVFEYCSYNNLKKYISLDVKGYFNNTCSIDENYLENMAKEVISLVNKYNLSQYVMVETDYKVFLDYIIKNDNNIECYLLSYGNLENTIKKAINRNYHGISFKYSDNSLTMTNVTFLKYNNLKLQLWTVNNSEHIEDIFKYSPDFIQTDNIYYDFKIINPD